MQITRLYDAACIKAKTAAASSSSSSSSSSAEPFPLTVAGLVHRFARPGWERPKIAAYVQRLHAEALDEADAVRLLSMSTRDQALMDELLEALRQREPTVIFTLFTEHILHLRHLIFAVLFPWFFPVVEVGGGGGLIRVVDGAELRDPTTRRPIRQLLPLIYHGKLSGPQRAAAIERFQRHRLGKTPRGFATRAAYEAAVRADRLKAPNELVAIVQSKSGGQGLNMDAGCRIFHTTLPFAHSETEQADFRCLRVTTRSDIRIFDFVNPHPHSGDSWVAFMQACNIEMSYFAMPHLLQQAADQRSRWMRVYAGDKRKRGGRTIAKFEVLSHWARERAREHEARCKGLEYKPELDDEAETAAPAAAPPGAAGAAEPRDDTSASDKGSSGEEEEEEETRHLGRPFGSANRPKSELDKDPATLKRREQRRRRAATRNELRAGGERAPKKTQSSRSRRAAGFYREARESAFSDDDAAAMSEGSDGEEAERQQEAEEPNSDDEAFLASEDDDEDPGDASASESGADATTQEKKKKKKEGKDAKTEDHRMTDELSGANGRVEEDEDDDPWLADYRAMLEQRKRASARPQAEQQARLHQRMLAVPEEFWLDLPDPVLSAAPIVAASSSSSSSAPVAAAPEPMQDVDAIEAAEHRGEKRSMDSMLAGAADSEAPAAKRSCSRSELAS